MGVERLDAIDPSLCDRRAESRAQTRVGRDEHGPDLEALRDGPRVEWARAAEGDEAEVARVEAAFDRDEPDGVRHVLVGRPHRRQGGPLGREAELGAEPGERGAGCVASSGIAPPRK